MPIRTGVVPLHDVFWFGPEIPNSIDRRIDGGFYSDGLHVEEFDDRNTKCIGKKDVFSINSIPAQSQFYPL